MTTPPKSEKTDDAVQGQFIPMREPPGRLGAIVRRMKRMAPAPSPSLSHDGATDKRDAE